MLLRLHPEDTSKPIDFREGRWGHQLHASTFRGLPPLKARRWSWLPWLRVAEPVSTRRISFMCHTSDTPEIGREVIWTTATGDRTGKIYDVDFCRDPRDMMTLKVVIASTPDTLRGDAK